MHISPSCKELETAKDWLTSLSPTESTSSAHCVPRPRTTVARLYGWIFRSFAEHKTGSVSNLCDCVQQRIAHAAHACLEPVHVSGQGHMRVSVVKALCVFFLVLAGATLFITAVEPQVAEVSKQQNLQIPNDNDILTIGTRCRMSTSRQIR